MRTAARKVLTLWAGLVGMASLPGGWSGDSVYQTSLAMAQAGSASSPTAAPRAQTPEEPRLSLSGRSAQRSDQVEGTTQPGLIIPLKISAFGRFSFRVQSEVGVGLQLVDKVEGPRSMVGIPGKQDARMDVFLETGDYRLILHPPPNAPTVRYSLMGAAFEELQEGPSPQLLPALPHAETVVTTLGDLQQRSWWIEQREEAPIALEVAGRAVSDLRLWRDGAWLTPDLPACRVLDSAPQRVCRLAARLTPGRYQVTVYGGPLLPQATGGDDRSLRVRLGIPRMTGPVRMKRTFGPMGVERFVIPAGMTYARLELTEPGAATIGVGPYDPSQPFAAPSARGEITLKSVLPSTALSFPASTGSAGNGHLVTVEGIPGKSYFLQTFAASSGFVPLSLQGTQLIGTLHGASSGDVIDATGVLLRSPRPDPAAPSSQRARRPRMEVVASNAIPLSSSDGWIRRFNLPGVATLLVEVKEAGQYQLEPLEGLARARIEPYLQQLSDTQPGRGYEPPPLREGVLKEELNPGFYVVTFEPLKQGIVRYALLPTVRGKTAQLEALRKMLEAPGAQPPRSGLFFGAQTLDPGFEYVLYRATQPGVVAGHYATALPLTGDQTVPLSLRPGQSLKLPVKVSVPSNVQLLTELGEPLKFQVGGEPPTASTTLAPGEHTLTVVGDARSDLAVMLFLENKVEVPVIKKESVNTVPGISLATPLYFDLAQQGSFTAQVEVEAPGLYRLETTGLLATRGTLRTRTSPGLEPASQNGVGRNFRLESWLGAGAYQAHVQGEETTRGRAGLTLTRSPLKPGGRLTPGAATAMTLEAGEGAEYALQLDAPGTYHLRSFAAGQFLRLQLEDADGWPLLVPGSVADQRLKLPAGHYRLRIYPSPLRLRTITQISLVPSPLTRDGHGPFSLPLTETIAHEWQEPASGAVRHPDVWLFTLPAQVPVQLVLTDGMVGELVALKGQGEVDASKPSIRVPPTLGWRGTLPAGQYRLETVAARPSNRLPYTVAVFPETLVDGLSVMGEVSAYRPWTLPLTVGTESLVSIRSLCGQDVRARLRGPDSSTVVVEQDDGPDDWNFRIVQKLAPGTYTLEVTAETEATCEVSMNVLSDVLLPLSPLPLQQSLPAERTSRVIPLKLTGAAPLLLAAAQVSPECPRGAVGLALERVLTEKPSGRSTEGARTETLATSEGRSPVVSMLMSMLMKSPKDATQDPPFIQLRYWSVGEPCGSVKLEAMEISPPHLTTQALPAGPSVKVVPKFERPVAAAWLDAGSPGFLRLTPQTTALHPLWCDRPGEGCRPVRGDILDLRQGSGMLVVPMESQGSTASVGHTLQAQPLALETGRSLRVPVAAGAESEGRYARLQPSQLELKGGGLGPVVVLARAELGTAPVQLVTDAQAPIGISGTGVAPTSTVAVSLSNWQRSAVRFWQGAKDVANSSVDLIVHRFTRPVAESWQGETLDLALASGQARHILLPAAQANASSLPPGATARELTLRITLEPHCLAVLARGEQVERVLWQDGIPSTTVLSTTATDLLVFSLSDRSSMASLATPAGGMSEQLRTGVRVGRPLEAPINATSSLSIPIQVPAEIPAESGASGTTRESSSRPGVITATALRLQWTGDVTRVRFVGASGRVEAPEDAQQSSLTVSESGTLLLDAGPGALRVWLSSLDTPVGARILPLPVGQDLRALPLLADGMGPLALFSPGEARSYRVEIKKEMTLGLGIRAEREVVQGTLVDADGRVLSTGTVLMPHLVPGTYRFVLELSPHEQPVQARPVVVGLIDPGTLPPEAVQRLFREAGQTASSRLVAPQQPGNSSGMRWDFVGDITPFARPATPRSHAYSLPLERLPMEGPSLRAADAAEDAEVEPADETPASEDEEEQEPPDSEPADPEE